MMQSREVRRDKDGSIDFDFYRARAAIMRSQSRQDAFKHVATMKFVVATAAVLGAVLLLRSMIHLGDLDNRGTNYTAKIENRERDAGSLFRWPVGARPESAHFLRERVEVLVNSDPQKWWDGYGKTTSRGQAAALNDLQRRLGGSGTVMVIR